MVKNSEADSYLNKTPGNKTPVYVSNGIRLNSVSDFITGLPNVFLKSKAKNKDFSIQFIFIGMEEGNIMVNVKNGVLDMKDGFGEDTHAQLRVKVDSETWVITQVELYY